MIAIMVGWRVMLRWIITFIAVLSPCLALAQGLTVTIRNGDSSGNNYFLVNGTPRYLVFISYFDAFDVPATDLVADLRYLRARGVDGIRIMPNWWTALNDYTA